MTQEKLPKSWEQDSALRSVYFVDHDSGWAVGDRGTILRTEDGGRTWNSISSPRDVVWSKVIFINEKVGWIVGGHYRGSFDRSVGVMIRTIDGGKTWQNHSQNGMPFVKNIDFSDEQNGWVFCDSNSIHTSGLLTTKDGGHTWRNAAGIPSKKLKIAKKIDGSSIYVGVDESNRWIQMERSVQVGLTVPFNQPTKLLESDRSFLSVADGKLFRKLRDGNWKQIAQQYEQNAIRWNDSVSKSNRFCAVGSPGHLVLFSEDNGSQWRPSRTGQNAQLNSVFFLDAERGWAVGDFGRVIATRDGGQTWTIQRNPDLQAGVMHLVSSPDQICYPAIALLGGSFNHLCNVTILDSRTNQTVNLWKLRQAASRAGNSSLEYSAVMESNLLLQAVKTIRAHKPSVVFINDQDSVMKRWVRLVIDAASDQEKFQLLTENGLHPWKVQKVISVSQEVALDQPVSLDRFSAQLGRTVSLQARFAAQLFDADAKSKEISWSLLSSSLRSSFIQNGITSGTVAYDGHHCNRKTQQLQIDNMQQFRSISNWNQNIDRLGREWIHSELDEKVWMENVTAATSGMDKLSYAFFLNDLANRYTELKKPVMADYAERLILQNVPDTEVGESSLFKMIQRYGSLESNNLLNRIVQKRMNKFQNGNAFGAPVRQASVDIPLDPVRSPNPSVRTEVETVDVTPASLQNATQLIDLFQSQFPDVSARPENEFLIARLKHATGNRVSLERLLDTANHLDFSSAIGSRINREKKITKLDGVVLDSFSALDATHQKVVLDGKLNEKFWNTGSAKTGLRFGADEEFIYIGMVSKVDNVFEVDKSRKRIRDEPLAGFRRKKIFIDFDRDYCSGIELTVDVRGSCNDALWRDSRTKDFSYDPTWYVASNIDESQWTVEIAIPMDQLPNVLVTPTSGWVVGTVDLEPRQEDPGSVDQLLKQNRVLLFRSSTGLSTESTN